MLHEMYKDKYNLPARTPRSNSKNRFTGWKGVYKANTTEFKEEYDRKWRNIRVPNIVDEKDILLEQVDHRELCKDVDLGSSSKYSMDQKIAVVATFLVCGNLLKAAQLNALPYDIVRGWKTRSKWWPEVEIEIKKAKSRVFDQLASKIILRCLSEIEDRLDNGNEVFDSKSQSIKKLKPDLKQLGNVMSQVFDKRQMVLGMPTSRTEHLKPDELLKTLRKEFQDIADGKVIEGIVEVKEIEAKK